MLYTVGVHIMYEVYHIGGVVLFYFPLTTKFLQGDGGFAAVKQVTGSVRGTTTTAVDRCI